MKGMSLSSLRRVASSMRVPLLVAAAFAGGAASAHFAGATPENGSPYLPLDQLARVLLVVEHDYVDAAPREKLVDGAIRGMVAELDPHSAYMNSEEFKEFLEEARGRFAGIGIEVDVRGDTITVIAPIEGSPAARAGIRSGDRVVAVDGRAIRGSRFDRALDLLRGEPGTKVRVTVGRDGEREPLSFELVREIVKVRSVEARRLDAGVLYVRLRQFQETTAEELVREVGRVRGDGGPELAGVVLDMRYNPGGLVDQAELVADELLHRGLIYSTRHRGQVLDRVEATRGGALASLPVVTIVNEYTASAAELVAGALQDHGRGPVVGAVTFGKGSVQTILDLPGGSALRLTTMRYYTPSGHAIQAKGIEPDVLVRPADARDVVREGGLDGALEAEELGQRRPNQEIVAAPAIPVEPVRVAELASDPRTGSDVLLRIAYERLLPRLGAR
jgi:carboxyl-terminal processing protease